jgi:phospholipase C
MFGAGAPLPAAAAPPPGSIPIQHVVIIMQENRSFDSYFGTFPKANGFPAGTCVPIKPKYPQDGCVVPFHNTLDINAGGGHHPGFAQSDLDDGITTLKQDGYVAGQNESGNEVCQTTSTPSAPACVGAAYGVQIHDAMGYHDADDIANYWTWAGKFVLQDALFAGERSWSYPSHLDLTSEWSAICTDDSDAMSCLSGDPGNPSNTTQLPWASLFQLLDLHGVSWTYYVNAGTEPDCADGEMSCVPRPQSYKNPSFWNVVPYYLYVKQQGKSYLDTHLADGSQFAADLRNGNLAQVSWIVPTDAQSEHPPAAVTAGMDYVTTLVDAVMASPYWKSTAIFITWDDWGGFYDHYGPPNVYDSSNKQLPIEGFGIRVPGIMISAWAKAGAVDHQIYSFASYARFIEDLFAGGARLDPAALGNPDNRGVIRDSITSVTFLDGHTEPMGDLLSEFDFNKDPIKPVILSNAIPSGIFASCGETGSSLVCTSPAVTVSWNAVGASVTPGPFTYHVLRDGTEIPGCTGTATSCTDTPGSGTHIYTVYSVGAGGAQSPNSAGSAAVEP